MKKIVRYTLRIAMIILCIWVLGWICVAGYIQLNKGSLLAKARNQLKLQFGDRCQVEGLDFSLFSHFPYMTLRFSGVSLRDSLWDQHHKDLLRAKKIDVRLSLQRSLFAGKVRVGKVYLEQGKIHLYTDSSGYSNTSILGGRSSSGNLDEKDFDPPDISLTDMQFIEEKLDKHKLFDLEIRQLEAGIEKRGRILEIAIHADLRAKSFSFNTEKGSFVRDRQISGEFSLQYNLGSKIIEGKQMALNIGEDRFLFSGRFFPAVSPDPFSLSIETDHILYRHVTALMTPDLQQKLDQYDIDQAVGVRAKLDAGSADDPSPQIHILMNLAGGSVLTPIGRFAGVSFRGSFSNEWVRGEQRGDPNSGIRLLSFSGALNGIPVESDTVTITNLKQPILSTELRSHFTLPSLNAVSGSQTLKFLQGNCVLKTFYRGPLSKNDTSSSSLRGYLDLDSAAVTYLPYQVTGSQIKGRILFKDRDLEIDHLSLKAGGSRMVLRGVARNLVSVLDNTARDVVMNWDLHSPRMDLRDILPIAGRPKEPGAQKSETSPFGSSSRHLDSLLRNGNIHLTMDAGSLTYQEFSGTNLQADLVLTGHEIRLNDMHMDEGGGTIGMKARLLKGGRATNDNPFSFESQLNGVDLPGLFSSFHDFGLGSLKAENLKGRLSANVRLTGSLDDKARLVPNSLKGHIGFTIRDGQLMDFGPMEEIHNKVLRKRHLSDIRFGALQTGVDLDSTTFTIHRMEIQSTALMLYVEGTYDVKKGPDLSLEIPVSNLKDRSPEVPPPNKGNNSKSGLSVRLRAHTAEDGKLKLSWDPFRKALKKKGA